MAEWFSTLLIVQKVWGSNPDRGENPCDWKTLSVHPAVSGYLIQFREGPKAKQKERNGLYLPYAFHSLL